jgi:hypothetical protein
MRYIYSNNCVFFFKCSKESVEKSIFSAQIGTVGVWVNNEVRLSDAVASRIEVGLYMEIIKGVGFFIAPEITFEPRW